jgi:hypothetical protein
MQYRGLISSSLARAVSLPLSSASSALRGPPTSAARTPIETLDSHYRPCLTLFNVSDPTGLPTLVQSVPPPHVILFSTKCRPSAAPDALHAFHDPIRSHAMICTSCWSFETPVLACRPADLPVRRLVMLCFGNCIVAVQILNFVARLPPNIICIYAFGRDGREPGELASWLAGEVGLDAFTILDTSVRIQSRGRAPPQAAHDVGLAVDYPRPILTRHCCLCWCLRFGIDEVDARA